MMVLGNYSGIVISISGGKDSQTILGVVMGMVREQGYSGQVFAVHADTGAEWPQSLPHCRMLAAHYGIELKVALPFRPLPQHIERRCRMMAAQIPRGAPGWPTAAERYCTSDCKASALDKALRAEFPASPKPGWPSATRRYCTSHCKTNALDKTMRSAFRAAGIPGWPSAACRYCTSDCKRGPIERTFRCQFPAPSGWDVLSVTGERREESPHRAKLSPIEVNKRLSAGKRVVTQWRPILDYKLQDVWNHIMATGLPRHVAYDRGNERLSCAICVLAKDADIRRGAVARPDLAEHYLRIERETGFTMKHGKSLAQILWG